MSALRERGTSVLFVAAAIFNLAIGLSLCLAPAELFAALEMPRPEPMVLLHLFAGFVVLFGLTYGWIARAPAENQPLIALGAVGKLGAFLIVAAHGAAGNVPVRLVALAAGDLFFALLFLVVLERLGPAKEPAA